MISHSIRLLLGALLVVSPNIDASLQNAETEQRQFSAEDETVKNPILIPQSIREILVSDRMVRDAADYDHISPERFPASWFLASAVHLGGNYEDDLVLIGQGPLRGANITQFWVFHRVANGYKLVLQASAHDLTVSKTIWNRLHEIELLSATATRVHTVLLRFDGERYRVSRDRWGPIQ